MKKVIVVLGMLMSIPSYSANTEWFEQNSSLTQAHQHLLTGKLPNMFDSLTELWQGSKSANVKAHLNEVLLQGLELDCGKGFSTSQLPEWIKSVTIRRIEIQSPGRDTYQFIADVGSLVQLKDISINQWFDKVPSRESSISTINGDGVTTYVRRYNLSHKLDIGLYRLNVTREDGTVWSQWVILENPKSNHTVHWTSKDEWVVEKSALPNSFCPLPKLNVSLYSFDTGKYAEIWHDAYESNYPQTLPRNIVEPNRYILAVSMNYLRWQGPILIEQSQVISKTYDVTND